MTLAYLATPQDVPGSLPLPAPRSSGTGPVMPEYEAILAELTALIGSTS